MKRFLRIYLLITLVLGISIVTLCTMMPPNEHSSTGGTGSEVVGVVNYPDSGSATAKRKSLPIPLIDGCVIMNPFDYLADTGNTSEEVKTYTDSDGSFLVESVLPGEHIVYIRDNKGYAIARRFTVREGQERVDLGVLHARKTAGVSVEYTGPNPGNVLFFIDVEGTNLQVKCSGGNVKATLEGIPIGTAYTVVVRMYRPVKKAYRFPSIELSAGITSVLEAITGD